MKSKIKKKADTPTTKPVKATAIVRKPRGGLMIGAPVKLPPAQKSKSVRERDSNGNQVLTESEARDLTDRIRATTNQLWALLEEAHRREAWRVLNYESWSAYVAGEFSFGQRRAYQLVEYGRFVRAIAGPAVNRGADIDLPTERISRLIRSEPALLEKARKRVAAGDTPKEAVEALVRVPASPAKEREAEVVRAVNAIRTLASLRISLEEVIGEAPAGLDTALDMARKWLSGERVGAA